MIQGIDFLPGMVIGIVFLIPAGCGIFSWGRNYFFKSKRKMTLRGHDRRRFWSNPLFIDPKFRRK